VHMACSSVSKPKPKPQSTRPISLSGCLAVGKPHYQGERDITKFLKGDALPLLYIQYFVQYGQFLAVGGVAYTAIVLPFMDSGVFERGNVR